MAEKMAHEYTSRDVRALIDERDTLRARVSALEAELKARRAEVTILRNCLSELDAELKALREQEPAGQGVEPLDGRTNVLWFGRLPAPGERVYFASAQVPDGYVPVPKIVGISRMFDNDRALLLCVDRRPSDDDIRNIHDLLSAAQANEGKP